MFGSTYWQAMARAIWKLEHEPDDYGRRMTLVKRNGGESGERYRLHYHHTGSRLDRVECVPWVDEQQ